MNKLKSLQSMGIVALKKDFETRIIRGGSFVSNFIPVIVKIGLC